MGWAWLWTACLFLAQWPHHLQLHCKVHLWLSWPSVMAFWTFSGAFCQPIPSPSLLPAMHQCTDPLSSLWFPQSHLGSWFCLAPHLWTSVPSKQHKWGLLHTGCWADFCKRPLVHTLSEQSTPGNNSRHPKGKAAAVGHSQRGSRAL